MITTETQFNRRKLITAALGFTGAGILAGCQSEPTEPLDPDALTSFDQYRGSVSYTHLTLPTNREV